MYKTDINNGLEKDKTNKIKQIESQLMFVVLHPEHKIVRRLNSYLLTNLSRLMIIESFTE